MYRPTSLTPSRRQTLGLALLSIAGLREAAAIDAKTKNKKNRKKKDTCERKIVRAVADRCGQQGEFCVASVLPACARASDIPACQAVVRECCDALNQCDMPSYLTCIQQKFEPLIAP